MIVLECWWLSINLIISFIFILSLPTYFVFLFFIRGKYLLAPTGPSLTYLHLTWQYTKKKKKRKKKKKWLEINDNNNHIRYRAVKTNHGLQKMMFSWCPARTKKLNKYVMKMHLNSHHHHKHLKDNKLNRPGQSVHDLEPYLSNYRSWLPIDGPSVNWISFLFLFFWINTHTHTRIQNEELW